MSTTRSRCKPPHHNFSTRKLFWFDEKECKHMKREFSQAVKSGVAWNACRQLHGNTKPRCNDLSEDSLKLVQAIFYRIDPSKHTLLQKQPIRHITPVLWQQHLSTVFRRPTHNSSNLCQDTNEHTTSLRHNHSSSASYQSLPILFPGELGFFWQSCCMLTKAQPCQ
ncbi:hypothetical protein DUNSADRAFT_12335 [Dunaliella salina]|uniref:Encoded protein n=1 Tax=Dunaliella salina TaxID=3046 RepID=A0ABQ7GBI3_DUNSA|nr:hypothetical protein DUNSADRAFT_12335 [Dunaliella salina]|eukprot:KAF5831972.1 hypothetical protein DUNSADRAFT_12335 [Dunaliella salina]